MKKIKVIFPIVSLLAFFLAYACSPTVKTVEVTRIVSQTVMGSQLEKQISKVTITPTPFLLDTPSPTGERTPTSKWTPSFTETPWQIITLTPGLLVIDATTRPDVEKFVSKQYIEDYLVMNYSIKSFGGKVFCGYQPIGIGNDGKTIKLYLWITCEEYFLSGKELKIGTGIDIPVVLFVEIRNNQYKIVNTVDAGGGYRLLNINFPPEIQKIITNLETDPEAFTKGISEETQELKQDAQTYFGK